MTKGYGSVCPEFQPSLDDIDTASGERMCEQRPEIGQVNMKREHISRRKHL